MTRKASAVLVLGVVIMAAAWGVLRFTYSPYRPGRYTDTLPVLIYHCIGQPPSQRGGASAFDYLYVKPEMFRRQLAWLKQEGYRFLSLEEALAWQPGEKAVLITFDDGYTDNYTQAFHLLEEAGAKATLFMVAGYLDQSNYLAVDQLRELADSGLWSIGSHGLDHADLTVLAPAELANNLAMSKTRLEEVTGHEILALAYPKGAWNEAVVEAARGMYIAAFLAEPIDQAAAEPVTWPEMTWSREGVYGYLSLRDFQRLLGQYYP